MWLAEGGKWPAKPLHRPQYCCRPASWPGSCPRLCLGARVSIFFSRNSLLVWITHPLRSSLSQVPLWIWCPRGSMGPKTLPCKCALVTPVLVKAWVDKVNSLLVCGLTGNCIIPDFCSCIHFCGSIFSQNWNHSHSTCSHTGELCCLVCGCS